MSQPEAQAAGHDGDLKMSDARRAQLLARLRQPEDQFDEKKTTADRREVTRTLVGFAKSTPEGREAVLFIGAAPDGSFRGVKDPDGLERDIRRWVRDECCPPVSFTTEVIETEGYPIVAVCVPGGQRGLFFVGHAYERIGSETVRITPERLNELLAARSSKASRILEFKNKTVTVETVGCDIDGNNVDNFLRMEYECNVDGCDDHSVQLTKLDAGRSLSISMSRVELQRDTKRHRGLMLVVSRHR
jgi:hypothetical protein